MKAILNIFLVLIAIAGSSTGAYEDYSYDDSGYSYDSEYVMAVGDNDTGIAAIVEYDYYYGAINGNGEMIVEPYYDDASTYAYGIASFYDMESGLLDIYDINGYLLNTIYLDTTIDLSSFYAPIIGQDYSMTIPQGDYFGVVNALTGDFIVESKYTSISPYYDEYAMAYVEEDPYVRVIDLEGNEVEAFKGVQLFSSYISFVDGYAVMYDDTVGAYGLVDKNGYIIIDFKYEYLDYYGNGYLVFMQDGLYGLIDVYENVLIEPIYDDLYSNSIWSDGYFYAVTDFDYDNGFILDTAGNIVVEGAAGPSSYDMVPFYDADTGYYGYKDFYGNIVISPMFGFVYNFEYGY